ncbi:MAG: F0F1 ATP synthase subunit alpha [Planctomycetes bacterium]|nr:F0F1 ATP synthase subunit alpha [Planctomycetota bacterium]
MKFRTEEIASVLQAEIEKYEDHLDVAAVGRVLEVGDGVARVYGLSDAMAMELVEFDDHERTKGLVFNLEESSIGVVILGDYIGIQEGMIVRSTGKVFEVPVGTEVVGRVVDPTGKPLDGKGPIASNYTLPVERIAPGIAARQPVKVPLMTGLKAIDSMIPIGRGQRELIIGDRKTGKTAIAIDTIINQKGKNVWCFYVAIGQKDSTVRQIVEELTKAGAMEYTTIVNASSSMSAPLQYIAPYSGAAMAEYFLYERGQDTLCVYDDLTKQAQAYRQLSLILRRPPGREAYPGDVFYLHSRLLERAVKLAERFVIVKAGSTEGRDVSEKDSVNGRVYELHKEHDHQEHKHDLEGLGEGHETKKITASGGSMTALPVIETQEGEVSAYIPTNVISITDGQIYLVPDLFYAGVRPAINVGISVSRVGGNAQTPAMKKIAGTLRLDLASFRELEAFAQLGTELDTATQAKLDRGFRMVELLKQGQYAPYQLSDQVIVIWSAGQGYFDKIAVKDVQTFERKIIEEIHTTHKEIPEAIEKTKKIDDSWTIPLGKFMQHAVEGWLAHGHAAKVDPRQKG